MFGKQALKMLIQRISFALGICALLGLVAVQTVPAGAAPAEPAYVRVVHASPAAGNVDVFVDGNKLLSDFAFSTVTPYVTLPAGPHEIKVAPAGKGIGAAVITQLVSVEAGVPYTVAAVGTGANDLGLVAFGDNNLMDPTQAKVRVYHLSPNAGPVNVAAGGKTVITGLTYKNASDYLSVPPADYTFDVTATDAGATVPVKATLKAGTVNSVFAVGLFKGQPALKFVLATVNGVPGMPNTGSDPRATLATGNPALPWALGVAALLLFGLSLGMRFATAKKR